MSIWHRVENQEDVELSEDGTTIDVWIASDKDGNQYIEIPVEYIKKALEDTQTTEQ